ncbi:MAG: NACHT domain-containing protein, partial [Anaerolineales bacterium]|nr:NACHT domain-containing protein [Anaerolineales bacterium]
MKFFRRNQAEYETAVPHQPNIGPLSKHIALVFSRDEVRELCLDLAFSFDELPEKGLTEQCTYLVELLQRSGRLPELMSLLQEKRPRYNWQKPIVSTPQDLRNRDILLQSVQTHWIDGFLHQVLSQTIALELNLSYIPQAVARKTLYISGQIEDPLVDTPLSDVFEKHGRSLLILGEPGSGKTITMLQLAEALIAIAQDDSSQPVPVILNLSSWAQQKQPLQDWLVEELFLQYGMSRKLSRTWIAQNLLLYFLDGLDEVAAESRDACVQAINNFKAEYPAELVVCSRLADYEQLKEKLNVATAVRLHPLTDNQIQTYLSHPELELTAVRDALATDPNLNELAHSPLFLNIMTLAYRGFTREQLQSFGTLANRRKHLFDTYVEEMFRRRSLSRDFHYSPEQAANWLVNIANGMENHSLSIFYVERLQPSWLPTYTLRNQYARRVGWIAGQVGFWMTILAGEMLSRLNFGYSGLIIIFPLAIILGMFTGRSYYRDALKNSIKLTE